MSRHRGLKFWKSHIEALQESGFSIRRYAREHALCYASILNWRRRLLAKDNGFEEVKIHESVDEVSSSGVYVIDLESLSQKKLCALVLALAAVE